MGGDFFICPIAKMCNSSAYEASRPNDLPSGENVQRKTGRARTGETEEALRGKDTEAARVQGDRRKAGWGLRCREKQMTSGRHKGTADASGETATSLCKGRDGFARSRNGGFCEEDAG